jgi:hypothetical protein
MFWPQVQCSPPQQLRQMPRLRSVLLPLRLDSLVRVLASVVLLPASVVFPMPAPGVFLVRVSVGGLLLAVLVLPLPLVSVDLQVLEVAVRA